LKGSFTWPFHHHLKRNVKRNLGARNCPRLSARLSSVFFRQPDCKVLGLREAEPHEKQAVTASTHNSRQKRPGGKNLQAFFHGNDDHL
jgi:hypothetical protein